MVDYVVDVKAQIYSDVDVPEVSDTSNRCGGYSIDSVNDYSKINYLYTWQSTGNGNQASGYSK